MQSTCKQYWWVLPSSPRLQHYGNIDEYYWIAKIFKWAIGNTVQQFNSHSQDSRKYSSQVPHVPEHDPEIFEVNVKEPDYSNTSPTVLEVGHWYPFFLEKYQYWFTRIILEIKDNDQVKGDFLQQLTQFKNCFDSEVEVEVQQLF